MICYRCNKDGIYTKYTRNTMTITLRKICILQPVIIKFILVVYYFFIRKERISVNITADMEPGLQVTVLLRAIASMFQVLRLAKYRVRIVFNIVYRSTYSSI